MTGTSSVQQQGPDNRASNIYPLPMENTSSRSGTNLEDLLDDVFSASALENQFKSIVEGAVMEAWLKLRLTDLGPNDDPFDAIYISELQADNINDSDIKRVLKYSQISDISNTITFMDEWED
jgi:hypothetical protein